MGGGGGAVIDIQEDAVESRHWALKFCVSIHDRLINYSAGCDIYQVDSFF